MEQAFVHDEISEINYLMALLRLAIDVNTRHIYLATSLSVDVCNLTSAGTPTIVQEGAHGECQCIFSLDGVTPSVVPHGSYS